MMTLEEYVDYLDDTIRYWRNVRDLQEDPPELFSPDKAVYYIDAFQSARKTLIGQLLEVEERR